MVVLYIRERPFQKKSISLKDVVDEELVSYINNFFNIQTSCKLKYLDERGEGNYVLLEKDGTRNYIILLNYRMLFGKTQGRNSFYQSIPTAYFDYLTDNSSQKKIYFLDVGYVKNGKKNYNESVKQALRLALTAGIKPLYDCDLESYRNVEELMHSKQKISESSPQNSPTFIEKNGPNVIVYGKTFGANAKDTELLCYALLNLVENKIILQQVSNKKGEFLSNKVLRYFSKTNKITVFNSVDTFESLLDENVQEVNLRNPEFIMNLYEMYGHKKCSLCDCEIPEIIDGAHVLPIASIQKLPISDEQKLEMATDPKNGLWLCKNHHYLYDRDFLKIENGNYKINFNQLSYEDVNYIENSITWLNPKIEEISRDYIIMRESDN